MELKHAEIMLKKNNFNQKEIDKMPIEKVYILFYKLLSMGFNL